MWWRRGKALPHRQRQRPRRRQHPLGFQSRLAATARHIRTVLQIVKGIVERDTSAVVHTSYRVAIRLLPLCCEVRSVADVRGHVSRRVPGARNLRDRSSCGVTQQRRLQTPHRNGCLRTSARIGHSQNRVRLRRSARQLQRGHRPSDELRSPCIPYER